MGYHVALRACLAHLSSQPLTWGGHCSPMKQQGKSQGYLGFNKPRVLGTTHRAQRLVQSHSFSLEAWTQGAGRHNPASVCRWVILDIVDIGTGPGREGAERFKQEGLLDLTSRSSFLALVPGPSPRACASSSRSRATLLPETLWRTEQKQLSWGPPGWNHMKDGTGMAAVGSRLGREAGRWCGQDHSPSSPHLLGPPGTSTPEPTAANRLKDWWPLKVPGLAPDAWTSQGPAN